MEKELDPEVIKATQSGLGKYIKRPPLTEKLLKKPPFRFLHDIVTSVKKSTGFFEGLFEEDELVSENVKDRESKILFLNKVITILNITTGKSLSVKPSKIVAGQEPEKTNELLQCIAEALDNKLSSDDAVKRFKEGAKAPKSKVQQDEKKTKEQLNVKKTNEAKKLASKSSEKLTSQTTDSKINRDRGGRSQTRNEKEKVSNVTKSKSKENTTVKKESPPKKTQPTAPTKTINKKNSIEKISSVEKQPFGDKQKPKISTNTPNLTNTEQQGSGDNDQNERSFTGLSDTFTHNEASRDEVAPLKQPEERKLNATSYTIANHELDSSLSSQDLMDIGENPDDVSKDVPKGDERGEISADVKLPIEATNYSTDKDITIQADPEAKSKSNSSSAAIRESQSASKEINSKMIANSQEDAINESPKIERAPVRPVSVRPSSSRPGAPRLRDKHETAPTAAENLLVGKVNIIVENTTNEEEEESSIIIVDQQQEENSISQDQDQLQLSSNQHGHLVQQILDSQKEFSQNAGKTEIEWQFGAQKAREALNQEIEQLRFNIQALSRAANPLGKVLDHIQEDVEVMRQELQQWATAYEDTSKELVKQKMANEDSLLPLHTRLKQLDVDITEKRDKINDLKVVIHKNSARIEKLLASGNVQ